MIKGSARRHVAVLALLAAVAVPLTPASGASQATGGEVSAARAVHTPVSGAYFNNPTGIEAQQNRIVDRMIRMTDATPAGSVIRVATLNLEMDGPADALIAAHERGVHVRVVMPHAARESVQVDRLVAVLGGDVTADSYLVKCTFGCLSPSDLSTMHTKMFLFGKVGGARRVLTVTTANLTPGQTRAWNDAVTVVGKRAVYAAAVDYFDKMALDLPTREFTKTVTSGRYRLFLFPHPRKEGVDDYFTTSFKRIQCRGVPRKAPAGRDGRTVVRFRSTIWREDRVDVVDRLLELHRAGCHVRATINLELTDPLVKEALYEGGLNVRYWSKAEGHTVSHGKTIVISGLQRREVVNTVHTGSVNPSRVAERRNDNAMVQVLDDRAVTKKFLKSFAVVWDHSAPLTLEQVVNARPIPARVRG